MPLNGDMNNSIVYFNSSNGCFVSKVSALGLEMIIIDISSMYSPVSILLPAMLRWFVESYAAEMAILGTSLTLVHVKPLDRISDAWDKDVNIHDSHGSTM